MTDDAKLKKEAARKRHKKGLFPVVRLEQTRLWIVKYLTKAMETPMRQFSLKPKQYAAIPITTDASPEGLGGYLVVNKKMIAAFASKVAQEDAAQSFLEVNFFFQEDH